MRCGGGPRPSEIIGVHAVQVRDADLERARALLRASEGGFDDDELARLSVESKRRALAELASRASRGDGAALPAKPTLLHRLFSRLARAKSPDNPPNPFGR